jgi:hypothetical protein
MMKKIYLTINIMFISFMGIGQFAINSTGALPDPSAMLDLHSATNTKGMLIPRMPKANRIGIASPAQGLMVYQTDAEEGYFYYTGAAWKAIPRLTDGTISMGTLSSTIDYGTGFSVVRLTDGQDYIQFLTPLPSVPSIIVTSSVGPGTPPETDSYCFSNFTNCTTHHIRDFQIDYPVGGLNEINNPSSFCTGTTDRFSLSTPATTPLIYPSGALIVTAGTNMTIKYRVDADATATALSIWIDLNQDGFLAIAERIKADVAVTPGTTITYAYPVPLSVCNGRTIIRAVARAVNPTISVDGVGATTVTVPCYISGVATQGETEDYEINFAGGATCSFPDRQSVCNVGDISPVGFKVSCAETSNNAAKNVEKYHFIAIEN